MEIITMILSGLALLAATVCLVLIIREKKRNQKRNADFANLLRAEIETASGEITALLTEIYDTGRKNYGGLLARLNAIDSLLRGKLDELEGSISQYDEQIPGIVKNVQDLMQGVVPDYNEALAAKDAVDSFNKGISGILGFDPMEAARKQRERNLYGGEVD